MRQLLIRPCIYKYETVSSFLNEFHIGTGDLIVTNEYIFNPWFSGFKIDADVVFVEKYGVGEPTDEMVEAIIKDIIGTHKRIIAIGGGTIIDIAKLLSLKYVSPVIDLFDGKLKIIKDKELVIVPTTCGTGSEVTNISILELKSRNTKMGLAVDELYGDSAVLIPEIISTLPFKYFATSSIDAFIHAIESCVSPKATPYTEMYSYKAMEMIINGYKHIACHGKDSRIGLQEDFLLASNYAGIAFSNAGCGAVHALSYPLSGKYHVPHGEANYVLFAQVFKAYVNLRGSGKIDKINTFLSQLLACSNSEVYDEIEKLFNVILQKKSLSEYGVKPEDLIGLADNVMLKQGRLMANNYTELTHQDVYDIYMSIY